MLSRQMSLQRRTVGASQLGEVADQPIFSTYVGCCLHLRRLAERDSVHSSFLCDFYTVHKAVEMGNPDCFSCAVE